MSPLLLIWLAACAPSEQALTPSLVARVDDPKVEASEPIRLEIRATAPDGWTVRPGEPSAEGLTVRSTGTDTPPSEDGAQVFVTRYELSGPPGSYVIEPGAGEALGPGDEKLPLAPGPIFVDIGVQGPTGGPMAEVEDIPAEETSWLALGLAAATTLAVGAAIALWRRRRVRALPPPPPEPPHVVALRAWEQARVSGQDDHAVALQLSTILRAYLEAITGFPATARTTREILTELERSGRLGPSLRMNAAHVLDATDRLKFAREGGGEPFFQALDEDFFAVVEATRPRDPTPPPAEAPRA